MSELFNTLLIIPIVNMLVACYQLLTAIGVPYALGFAIILLTSLIRIALYPLTASQLRASKKMQDITPHLSRLRDKHKKDAQRLQQETLALYREHGVNPAAGCLPVLIQLPMLWSLYSVLQKVVGLKAEETVKYINDLVYFDFLKLQDVWHTTFFGLPLGQNPSQLLPVVGPAILLIPFLTGVFQFVQSKMMIKPAAEQEKTKKTEPDFAQAFQTQSLYIFPVMIGFFSYQFPVGLSLYWNTFTLFGMIQQYKIQGLGGLTDLLQLVGKKQQEKKQVALPEKAESGKTKTKSKTKTRKKKK